jgi:hypothetical protein
LVKLIYGIASTTGDLESNFRAEMKEAVGEHRFHSEYKCLRNLGAPQTKDSVWLILCGSEERSWS